MSETTYSVEFAKSGRSKCKRCKQPIAKGEMRLGVLAKGGDFDLQSWYKPACFKLPRKFIKAQTTPDDFVRDVLEDSTGGDILPAKHDEIVAAIEAAAAGGGKAKSEKGSSDQASGASQLMKEFNVIYKEMEKENKKKKRKKDDFADENEDPQPKTKRFKGSKEEETMFNIYGKFYKYNIDEIKDILRNNRQVMTGTKDFLMFKLIDGEMNGRIARCSLCNGGRLKFKDDTGITVVCGGSFDEDTQMRMDCGFSCPAKEAPRWKPWFTEEPTQEEKDEMDKLEAEAKGEEVDGNGSDSKKGKLEDDVGADLVQKVKDMEWDVSDKEGIKTMAKYLCRILMKNNEKKQNQLDLPEDKSTLRMDVGTLIVTNRSLSSTEILKLVVKKYGLVDQKAKKLKQKETALEAICKHPKNAPLLQVFQELGERYFKDGNRNAGTSYMKVVKVIKDLDFVVTEDNALGLGKGKTKIAGIGKGSAEKMHEFCTTGTIAKLEEKRLASS